jgi:photosynthetic reaction center H subunit
MWVDAPEQVVRYLEVSLTSGGKRLIPMPMAKIGDRSVKVSAMAADGFAGIPTTRANDTVTMLEEEKISGYVAGGTMYSAGALPSKWKVLFG